jgi:tRNA(Ile2) C34 agmatinyltransferase TiaS
MKLAGKPVEYRCDKCGITCSREEIASLSTSFQPGGLVDYRQGNMGVRHLCESCKQQFEAEFKEWFTEYNFVVNPPKKVFINSPIN